MTQQDTSIKHLLTQIAEINKRFKKVAEITGENFNVFKILNLTSNEVRTHSAILCELLNINGSHGFKNVFLDLFLSQQREKSKDKKDFLMRLSSFNTANSITKSESHIGFISQDGTEGGRIDILIKDDQNNAIIIENKINTGDQDKQLVRYFNAYKNAPIFYLTLNGSEPSNKSKDRLNEGIEYVSISYKSDILNWLEQCQKEAVNHPILRETITQYINLIKYLTNQTINEAMEKEIVDLIISTNENLEAAYNVAQNLSLAKTRIVYEDFNKLLEEISKELNLELEKRVETNKKWAGFGFKVPKWSYFMIYFEFEGSDFRDLGYMFKLMNVENPCQKEVIEKLYKKFEKHNDKNKTIPLGWTNLSKYQNWDLEALKAIRSGEIKDEFKTTIQNLLALSKGLEM